MNSEKTYQTDTYDNYIFIQNTTKIKHEWKRNER